MTKPTPGLHNGKGGRLPIAPIRRIIRADIERAYRKHASDSSGGQRHHPLAGIAILAKRVGLAEHRLASLASGDLQTIPLDDADRYLCTTGRQLREAYPALYTDEQIQADIEAVEGKAARVEHDAEWLRVRFSKIMPPLADDRESVAAGAGLTTDKPERIT